MTQVPKIEKEAYQHQQSYKTVCDAEELREYENWRLWTFLMAAGKKRKVRTHEGNGNNFPISHPIWFKFQT